MCSPLGRTTLTLPTRLLRVCLPANFVRAGQGRQGTGLSRSPVAGGESRPAARCAGQCWSTLTRSTESWFGQRWLKFRAVMLAPNKWQYAALPNLFAMQQRREQSCPQHHSQQLAEEEEARHTQHSAFPSHDCDNAPSCKLADGSWSDCNGNVTTKDITVSDSPHLHANCNGDTWASGSCDRLAQMPDGPRDCDDIHTTSSDRSETNEIERCADRIARRCPPRDHAFKEAVYLSATGILRRETREGLAEHFRDTFPAGSHGPEWPLRSLDDGRSAGVAGLWCFLAQAGRPFPKLRHEPGRLKAFYVLNAASLLPVLALDVRSGERVLDMCAAPGGKTLGILQCAQPSLLCANEPDELRRRRLLLALESFVPRSALRSLVAVSARDGCELGALQPASYDKVLVDAPCSNDRSWLYGGSEALAELRVRERAHLPGLQTQLLRSALRAVKPGGIVVYATCTLNARENAGVVRAVLEGNAGVDAEVVDLADMARGLQGVFSLDGVPGGSGGGAGEQPGLLVVPEEGRAWGPLYLCKLRRQS
ncbi:tRNA (cytosine(34)-C(5))-methyltransferase, mitochondrial isoform X2 [Lethenteron reissneri]|uniref:tRNA (cytosine(34)-C(5))-methyltransferase, mitochondrial isoform X2 n=1 Tax=Lethenteron reissneri TaxID=7753 RepID=UPI002AB76B67|nr:tRNA (cytosine(34)-C(5))-methyltransferase, mitochondrial isoform X2 [Lethenteron reissneri]